MKKFVYLAFRFLLVLVIIFGGIYSFNLYVIANYSPNLSERVLLLGDSHAMRALDPKQFSSARNLSIAAEPYPVTFLKVKYILKKYKPDTIILSFSPHNLSLFNDRKFLQDPIMGELYSRNYALIDDQFLNNIPHNDRKWRQVYLRKMIVSPRLNHFGFLGHYMSREEKFRSNSSNAVKRHYFEGDSVLASSELGRIYLDSILLACNANKVVPILVGTPLHHTYWNRIPTNHKDYFEHTKMHIIKSGDLILDYSQSNFPDSLFQDSDHLNGKGGCHFTQMLIEDLRK